MEESIQTFGGPNLNRSLFWDWKVEEMDWQKAYRSVIERVLSRGTDQDYEELIRFYGRDRIVHALTKEHVSLPNFMLDHVTGYFGLKKEALSVYQRRLKRHYTWL